MSEEKKFYIDPAALILAAAAAIASYLICRNVLGLVSHVPDETSYLFQGRIFASGRLWLQPPSVPQGFVIDHVVMTDSRWCSIYPLGWPLLLAFGWLAGNPWAVNPLITGLSALGVWRLAQVSYDRITARIACALFCVSPFVLMTGSGSMAHMPALCALVWCLAVLVTAINSQQRKYFLIAGLLAGIAFLIRPFSLIFLLPPAFLWSLKKKGTLALWSLAGFFPCAILFCIYNVIVFDDPLRAGYPADPLYKPVSFSVRYLSENIIWYLRALNASLWRLPWPDLLILVPLIFLRRKIEAGWMMILCSLSLIAAYCGFSYHDIVYSGPRYLFEITGFISVLAGRSLKLVIDRVHKKAFQILIVLPFLILPVGYALPDQLRYHSQIYHGQSREFVKVLEQRGVGQNALVLLSGDPFTLRTFFLFNALEPKKGNRVFMQDHPEKRAEILNAYPRDQVVVFNILLDPLPGPNLYPDRFRLKQATVTFLQK